MLSRKIIEDCEILVVMTRVNSIDNDMLINTKIKKITIMIIKLIYHDYGILIFHSKKVLLYLIREVFFI